jgi:hypothetical protein
MSMSGDSIDKLYYSQNNLDNTFKQVSEEISRRTNKDIANNMSYKKSFQAMAKMVYDKCPPQERNLQSVNTKLIEKTVIYFHSKIFEKNVNNPTEKQSNQSIRNAIISKAASSALSSSSISNSNNTSTQHGFSMMKENNDIKGKYEEIMAKRDAITNSIGSGNPNDYLPQPVIKSNNYVDKEVFVKGNNTNNDSNYNSQYLRIADESNLNKSTLQTSSQMNAQNLDFSINYFNLNEDLTDSLTGAENVDSPLYQNIEKLQKMDSTNPMSMLEDYQRQRNNQIQSYKDLEKRENITAMQTMQTIQNSGQSKSPQLSIGGLLDNQNSVFNRNNTDAKTKIDQTQVDPMQLLNYGKQLTDNYMERIEERIVNSNEAQPNANSPNDLAKLQDELIKLQRDNQPKYIEKVHYINVNSVDRLWENSAESRFSFKVQFNQGPGFDGAAISQLYKNIVSVELVSAILPMDTTINTFDTRIYGGLMKYPYLLLRIDELDGVFRGTNNWADRAFSTLLFDKVYYTNTLSTDYITGTSSIVNSTPKTTFYPEYLRGFMKFNPAYFEKKKFYNNPLASLNKMTITITDPRGNPFNTQNDFLSISNIGFTSSLNTVSGLELAPSLSFPYVNQSSYKMIKVTSTSTFSNRLFRVGDRLLFKGFSSNISLATNNGAFNSFITKTEGHVIVNLDLEDNTASGGNKSFITNLYISPPGEYSATSNTVSGYYDNTTLDFTNATFGSVINMDLQSHLLFRIVTRDPDTSGVMKPINVY